MTQKEAFIVDIICMNVDPIYTLKSCHVTGCAIASTREEASIMIQDRLVSRSFVVIDILNVLPVSSLATNDNNKEQTLIRRARSSPTDCSVILIPFSGEGLSLGQINAYPSSANQMHS
jgi:hypothetical protein